MILLTLYIYYIFIDLSAPVKQMNTILQNVGKLLKKSNEVECGKVKIVVVPSEGINFGDDLIQRFELSINRDDLLLFK